MFDLIGFDGRTGLKKLRGGSSKEQKDAETKEKYVHYFYDSYKGFDSSKIPPHLHKTLPPPIVIHEAASPRKYSLRGYGNYCGPYWSDGKLQPSVVGSKAPINALDSDCKAHDAAYATHTDSAILTYHDDKFATNASKRGILGRIFGSAVKLNRLSRPSWWLGRSHTPVGSVDTFQHKNIDNNYNITHHSNSEMTQPDFRFNAVTIIHLAVGECGLAAAGEVPILRNFYQMYYRNGIKSKIGLSPEMMSGMRWLVKGLAPKAGPIANVTRLDVYIAWGIPPALQLEIETIYDGLSFGNEVRSVDTIDEVLTALYL